MRGEWFLKAEKHFIVLNHYFGKDRTVGNGYILCQRKGRYSGRDTTKRVEYMYSKEYIDVNRNASSTSAPVMVVHLAS